MGILYLRLHFFQTFEGFLFWDEVLGGISYYLPINRFAQVLLYIHGYGYNDHVPRIAQRRADFGDTVVHEIGILKSGL